MTATTTYTQQIEERTSCPEKSLKIGESTKQKIPNLESKDNFLPTALRIHNPYSKQGLNRLNSHSSSNKLVFKPQPSDLIALKLAQPSGYTNQKSTKQQGAPLNLIRFVFQLIELLNKVSDNIHCTYLNIDSVFLSKLANFVIFLLNEFR